MGYWTSRIWHTSTEPHCIATDVNQLSSFFEKLGGLRIIFTQINYLRCQIAKNVQYGFSQILRSIIANIIDQISSATVRRGKLHDRVLTDRIHLCSPSMYTALALYSAPPSRIKLGGYGPICSSPNMTQLFRCPTAMVLAAVRKIIIAAWRIFS